MLTIGTVLGEIDTDGYTLRQRSDARTVIVSIDPARIGHCGPVTGHILARPDVFVAALVRAGRAHRTPSGRPGARGCVRRLERFSEIRHSHFRVWPGAPVTRPVSCGSWCHCCPRDVLVTSGVG